MSLTDTMFGLDQYAEPADANDTQLTEQEEKEFKKWKKLNLPDSFDENYDYRGAFKNNAQPNPSDNQLPSEFKKPIVGTPVIESPKDFSAALDPKIEKFKTKTQDDYTKEGRRYIYGIKPGDANYESAEPTKKQTLKRSGKNILNSLGGLFLPPLLDNIKTEAGVNLGANQRFKNDQELLGKNLIDIKNQQLNERGLKTEERLQTTLKDLNDFRVKTFEEKALDREQKKQFKDSDREMKALELAFKDKVFNNTTEDRALKNEYQALKNKHLTLNEGLTGETGNAAVLDKLNAELSSGILAFKKKLTEAGTKPTEEKSRRYSKMGTGEQSDGKGGFQTVVQYARHSTPQEIAAGMAPMVALAPMPLGLTPEDMEGLGTPVGPGKVTNTAPPGIPPPPDVTKAFQQAPAPGQKVNKSIVPKLTAVDTNKLTVALSAYQGEEEVHNAMDRLEAKGIDPFGPVKSWLNGKATEHSINTDPDIQAIYGGMKAMASFMMTMHGTRGQYTLDDFKQGMSGAMGNRETFKAALKTFASGAAQKLATSMGPGAEPKIASVRQALQKQGLSKHSWDPFGVRQSNPANQALNEATGLPKGAKVMSNQEADDYIKETKKKLGIK